jgi:peptidoglycan/xylan/chitin deacetylase (PgdA/CDA1 family)
MSRSIDIMTAPTNAVVEPTYAECQRQAPEGMRSRARSAALSTLSWIAERMGSTQAGLHRPRVHFVYLHHVLRDEEAGFRRLLAHFSRDHEFVGHGDAIERVRSGRIDRPCMTFSFDDGFADNARAAAVLEDYGARGCFFVCPAIVGQRDPATLRAFCADRLHFPCVSPFLDWAQLEQLLARGHEIGGHTMTHPDLGTIPPQEVLEEIGRSHDILKSRLGVAAHFAWPRGRWENFSPLARTAVFDAGFSSSASAVRGCHVTAAAGPAANLCIRREHVVANWPLGHVRYLLGKSARTASAASNGWPPEYPRAD